MSSFGVRIHNTNLELLRPVFQEWINCTLQYVELFGGDDLPYWYNERANVGILSAAAWKAGMVSLEEFQSHKHAVPSETDQTAQAENQIGKGRCDLYLADSTNEFFIEAKVCFPSITSNASCFDAGMSKIAKDRKNVGGKDSFHLSALFCAPHSYGTAASSKDIAQHLALAQEIEVDAHAWVAPAQAQKAGSHNNRYYPLISLFIKLVQSTENHK